MSATNDVSRSEDSANSLIDRSSGAPSTKKRDEPSGTSEDDAASASDAAPDAPSDSRDAKRRRVEPVSDPAPTPVPALAAIRQRLGKEFALLARPDDAVLLYPQTDGWSCTYMTVMTLVFALCQLNEYRRALAACGLFGVESGLVATVREIQTAIQGGWANDFGLQSKAMIVNKLDGADFVGSRERICCVDAGAALRNAGVRANVVGFNGLAVDATALSAAQGLVARLTAYFADGGDDAWGDFLPPALLVFADHSRVVVGVSRDRLVLLDPAWDAPQLECVSAEDLASRANQFEILVVRPGVRDASTLPTDFNRQA